MRQVRHRLRTFIFRRKVMFRSQDIWFFVFLTNKNGLTGCALSKFLFMRKM